MNETRASVRGALRLVGQGVDYVTARVYDVHHAIASGPYDVLERIPAVKAGAEIVRPLHLGGTAAVYAIIRGTSRALFAGADAALAQLGGKAGAAVGATPADSVAGASATPAGPVAGASATPAGPVAGAGATPADSVAGASATPRDGGGVLNALLGEHLARDGNPLGVRMGLRACGADLPSGREAMAAALPGATGRVVVFVHGLGCDDASWGNYAERL
ncbi:MAG TPA: hypothetical protein VFS00_19310, partial [Polyangiaceae bacterium]|nr:hypothetical protein [Polyangiaceae bacterium]